MTPNLTPEQINKARLLLMRLERISADSPWAHKASGIRASLSKCITNIEPDGEKLEKLMKKGFSILEKAAFEIPE
jgi:hypothetical protein